MNRIDSPSGRFYEIEKDVFFPSSTTILQARPMPIQLKIWLQENTKEEAERKLKEAGFQGSKIHHTIELILKGETISSQGITPEQLTKTMLVSDEDYGDKGLLIYLQQEYSKTEDKMMKGFLNFWEEFKPTTYFSEEMVYSKKHKYAGTADWIGEINIKGKPVTCLIDWKTGKGLYKDYDLQIASYVNAFGEMHKGKKAIKIKRAFLLQLGVNKCGYKLQEVKDLKADFKRFKDTIAIWKDINPNANPHNGYQFLNEYTLQKGGEKL